MIDVARTRPVELVYGLVGAEHLVVFDRDVALELREEVERWKTVSTWAQAIDMAKSSDDGPYDDERLTEIMEENEFGPDDEFLIADWNQDGEWPNALAEQSELPADWGLGVTTEDNLVSSGFDYVPVESEKALIDAAASAQVHLVRDDDFIWSLYDPLS